MMARVAPTMLRIFVLCGVVALPTAGCSSFDVLNAMVPSRASLRTSNVPYGAHPRQNLDVYRPRVNAKSAEPPAAGVVVFFYGGYWNSGSKADYRFVAEALTSQGFVAVLPDYRLYPDVTFPAFVEDGALAVRWARDNAARFGGDPNRIVTAGHSAGAYNAVMPALDRKWLAAEGLPDNVIKAAAGLAGPYDFYPFGKPSSINAMGRYPRPLETQPIRFVRADAPPMFLGHGSADGVVLPRNSRHLAQRLQQAGAPVTLRIYPGASHVDLAVGLSRTFRQRVPVLADSAAFLHQHSR